jgi:hypothetical protein
LRKICVVLIIILICTLWQKMLRWLNERHFNYLTENTQKNPFKIHKKQSNSIFKNSEDNHKWRVTQSFILHSSLFLIDLILSINPLPRSQNQIFKLRKPRFHTCTHSGYGLFQASSSQYMAYHPFFCWKIRLPWIAMSFDYKAHVFIWTSGCLIKPAL